MTVYYEPVPYDHQLEQDRLDRQWETSDRPDLYPPSPMSRHNTTASPAGADAGPAGQPVVDVRFLVATGWLPASKLNDLQETR